MALNHRPVFADKNMIICVLCFIQFVVYSIPHFSFLFGNFWFIYLVLMFFWVERGVYFQLTCTECAGLVARTPDERLCDSVFIGRKPFIWSEWLEDFILLASPPDLVHESLALLELSKLCHLYLHCVPVLNDENEFTSSVNLFSSRVISLNFWELSFPFIASLDSFQRSIKIFSSASDHGVLRIWRTFTTRLRIWRVRARRIHA